MWFGNGDAMEDDSIRMWENVHTMLMRTGVTWQRSLQQMAEDQLKCSQRWSIHRWIWQELSHSGGVSKTHSFIQRNHVSRPWEPSKTGAKGGHATKINTRMIVESLVRWVGMHVELKMIVNEDAMKNTSVVPARHQ